MTRDPGPSFSSPSRRSQRRVAWLATLALALAGVGFGAAGAAFDDGSYAQALCAEATGAFLIGSMGSVLHHVLRADIRDEMRGATRTTIAPSSGDPPVRQPSSQKP